MIINIKDYKVFYITLILTFHFIISFGQSIYEYQKVIPDNTVSKQFGWSVSISGNRMIVGELWDGENAFYSGAAFIFYDSSGVWIRCPKIIANDGEFGDNFGCSVDISGDNAIIGAYKVDGNGYDVGATYIFYDSSGTWVQKTKLFSNDNDTSDYFGFSVSLNGDYAIIGAPENDSIGAAYIFYDSSGTWVQQAKLINNNGSNLDNFGFSVSIYGDYAIVGAYGYTYGYDLNCGIAYIYHRNGTTWTLEQALTPSDTINQKAFGYAVDIYQDYAIVGAIYDNGTNGSAYIFYDSSGTWILQSKITSLDSVLADYFGTSVGITNDYAIVGKDNFGQLDKGNKAYLFSRNGNNWVQKYQLTASDSSYGDHFGYSVSISDDFCVVGAMGVDADAYYSNVGAAYIYSQRLPYFICEPINLYNNRCPGSSALFTVCGVNIENYRWQVSIDSGNTWLNLFDDSTYSGTTTDSLFIIVDTSLSNNFYRCMIENSASTDYSNMVILQTDTIIPDITQCLSVVNLDSTGNATISASDFSYYDNCSISNVTLSQTTFDCTDINNNPHSVVLTITDNSGNQAIDTVSIYVFDVTYPKLSTQNIIVYLDSTGYTSILSSDVVTYAYDKCGIADTILSQDAFYCNDVGVVDVYVTLSDIQGHYVKDTIQVTVLDTINPLITCINDQNVIINQSDSVYIVQGTEFDPVIYCNTDSIFNNFNNINTLASEEFPIGTTYITWYVIDESGNSNSCSFNITVNNSNGIDNIFNSDFSIYPNPSSSNFVIHFDKTYLKNIGFEIYNVLGQKQDVKVTKNNDGFILNLTDKEAGVYFIKIFIGNDVYTKKVVLIK